MRGIWIIKNSFDNNRTLINLMGAGMQLKIIGMIVVSFYSLFSFGQLRCPDTDLSKKGWDIKQVSNLDTMSEKLKKPIISHPAEYSVEGTYKMYSTIARTWVELHSVDSLATPKNEMFGDMLWISDLQTGELIELRWYEAQKVHVAYNPDYQSCATHLIPIADNSLF